MPTERTTDRKPSMIVSALESDGTLVETIFRPDAGETALVVARDGEIDVMARWQRGDHTFVPVSATNNLVRHRALVLPSAATEYSDTAALVAEIESYIRRYVHLGDAEVGLSAAYVLLSWVYDAFNELPYLRYRGDYGTGKTRALLVVGSLCYKAFFASGASTVSPIFHTLNTFQGTLIFDEADFRFTDEKAELVKILNNGNAKGFPVLRTHVSEKREFDPRAFVIFGPKIVGMRRAYDDRALESRFLTVDMQPGQADGVPINLPDSQKEEALALRNKLLMYRLRNRLSVCLDASLADPMLEPRMNQILLPLLCVAPKPMRSCIREAARALQASIVSERGATSEGQVLSVLGSSPDKLPVSEIATSFMLVYGSDYERPITNRWIGSILRRLGLALYKSDGVYVLAPGQRQRIDALYARYGIAGEKPGTKSG